MTLGRRGSILLLLGLLAPSPGAAAPAEPVRAVRVQAIRVSDDDGRRAARVSPEQIRLWLDFANRAFAGAGISFRFEDADVSELKSTLLNGMMGTQDPDWPKEKALANEVAARHPGRVAIFFRHGPGPAEDGSGFSWFDCDFVVMPGYGAAGHCGHAHRDALAHELGHYLGLPHTFAAGPFATEAEAEAHLLAGGGAPALFDGDGFGDTPPDPSIRPMECGRQARVVLAGRDFALPRDNLMSYYDERRGLSESQIRRVRWMFDLRAGNGMAVPSNRGAGPGWEAEDLNVEDRQGVGTSVQPMAGFGKGSWSGDAQLFGAGQPGGSLTLALPVAEAGRYRLALFATRAPDFGRWQASLDSRAVGEVFDGYAPVVLPSGRFPLGEAELAAGKHFLRLEVLGKSESGSDFRFGLDYVELEKQ